MYRNPLKLTVIGVLMLAVVPIAQAITFGQPDKNNDYPNVGAIMVSWPNGTKWRICSGTLIDPKVFLTAAHCTAAAAYLLRVPKDQIYVSFDQDPFDVSATLYQGTYYLNPNYGHDMHDANDVAVIILNEPIEDITPAVLPPAELLTEMKRNHELKSQQFVAVGYGALRNDKTKGPDALVNYGPIYGERYFVEQTFLALEPYWLQISQNPSTGNGGTCFGDSGGPHFLVEANGETNMVVSLTVTGDHWCRAIDKTYRLDTDSARSYLSEFLPLP